MAGRRDRFEHVAAQRHPVAVAQPLMCYPKVALDGSKKRRTLGSQLGTPRHEVRMRVGVRGERDPKPSRLGFRAFELRNATRIDNQGSPIPEIHQVRRVPETFVDERGKYLAHSWVHLASCRPIQRSA